MAAQKLIRAALVAVLIALTSCRPVVEPVPHPLPTPTPVAEPIDPGSFEVEPTPIPTPITAPAVKTSPGPETTPEPTAEPTIPPVKAVVLVATPDAPGLTPASRTLIYEFEVGGKSGYNAHPEAPDARVSGITWGIGYDAHQNSKGAILADWARLGQTPVTRLAATQPYYGPSARAHLNEVRDIIVSWQHASNVFDTINVGREFAAAHRLWPGFDELRSNAQGALISQGFNRGWSTIGANRTEMREMRRLVPNKDYAGIAAQMRKSIRVWVGTSIYRGMVARRNAEAKLVVTP